MILLSTKEHQNYTIEDDSLLTEISYSQKFKIIYQGQDTSRFCFRIDKINSGKYELQTDYYIGIDWVVTNKKAIHIEPKINDEGTKIDIQKMLLTVLKHPGILSEVTSLFEIKWNQPGIEIPQQQDFLSVLLITHYISLLKNIVRKGLKKSYYKVENNLKGKIRGKVHISQTIQQNHIRQKKTYTYCSYDNFGINHKENRLLKKALTFIQKYISSFSNINLPNELYEDVNYIVPAFRNVSEKIAIKEIKQVKTNALFKEYESALQLAKIILKRFGYTIDNIKAEKTTIKTPPFWIDMPKLFELYVLGLLKDKYKHEVIYHYKSNYNELDYLLNTDNEKMVIDAKYKPKYCNNNKISKNDAWQVSGYARLFDVYNKLQIDSNKLIDCLIIYPDQENGYDNFSNIDLKKETIENYKEIYKIGVKLPIIT